MSTAPNADEYLGPERRARYLKLVSEGIALSLAAREVGCTGTQLRRLRKRDEEFGREVAEAIEEGRQHYADRLSSQARLRALDAERPSDRILEVELATHVPGYEHLRRNRIEIDGRMEHAILMPPGWLEEAPDEVLTWLAARGGEVIEDGEWHDLPALPEGNTGDGG